MSTWSDFAKELCGRYGTGAIALPMSGATILRPKVLLYALALDSVDERSDETPAHLGCDFLYSFQLPTCPFIGSTRYTKKSDAVSITIGSQDFSRSRSLNGAPLPTRCPATAKFPC